MRPIAGPRADVELQPQAGRGYLNDLTGNGFVEKHDARGTVEKLAENLGLQAGAWTRPLREDGDEPRKAVRQLVCFYFGGERRGDEHNQKGWQFHLVNDDSLRMLARKRRLLVTPVASCQPL